MDPITLLATASAIWSGIKKASEFAAEAEGVWRGDNYWGWYLYYLDDDFNGY